MKTIFNPGDLARLRARLDAVDPGCEPAWGALTASRMAAHAAAAAALRMGLGEVTSVRGPALLRHWPMNKLMMHTLPWPKGVPSGPQLLPEATEWSSARKDLDEVLDRFIAKGRGYADHAAFGKISAKDWGRLMHRHIDWHLRQFGA